MSSTANIPTPTLSSSASLPTITDPAYANNGTIISLSQCTVEICPLSEADYHFILTLIGNALFVGVFGLLFFIQIPLGIRYRIWGYLSCMCVGLAVEVVGYVGRIQLHFDPFDHNAYLMQLICLTIGPAFFSAAIYLCLVRIVVVYGEENSRIRPRTYIVTFVCGDFVSLVLQAVGGALAATATDQVSLDNGVDVMLAGLGSQVTSLVLFVALCADLAWRTYWSQDEGNPHFDDLRRSWRWKMFLYSIGIATSCILIRCTYRVIELSGGFNGTLAQMEIPFMILEPTMIAICCIAQTVSHPGPSFQGKWEAASFAVGTDEKGATAKGTLANYGPSANYNAGCGEEDPDGIYLNELEGSVEARAYEAVGANKGEP